MGQNWSFIDFKQNRQPIEISLQQVNFKRLLNIKAQIFGQQERNNIFPVVSLQLCLLFFCTFDNKQRLMGNE